MSILDTVPVLTGDRLVLRTPESGDADRRLALGRHDVLLRGYGIRVEDVSSTTAAAADSWLTEQERSGAWIITRDGRMIGTIRLHGIDRQDARAKLAVGLVDPDALGQGFGSEAVALVVSHAFDTLGLHRLSLRVLASNDRAIRCYARSDFVEEGRERKAARTWSVREDDVIMGLLAHEVAR